MQTPGIQLIINSATAEELNAKVISLAKQFGVDLSKAQATMVVEAEAPAIEKVVADKVEEKPKTKKASTKKETLVAEGGKGPLTVDAKALEAEEMEEVESPFTYTKDQVSSALQDLSARTNIETVKAVLAEFGAKRVSDLKEEDYPAVIAKIREY